ncbi:DNA cytosine methyltransferase [Azospirillum sp. A26]|uniref:DNA cytosine methyltransferase n=1 Tax=Azospirillum sp. A26 TaxID=3160607 RepID=UPI00366E5AC9
MDPITYGTVCSGIEAPSVAWEGLGWRPTFFSEIEAFPRQVLYQRQKAVDAARTNAAKLGVPLWGDFTAMRMRFFRRLGIRLPDVLCGGTPCQAFSLAGLRQSLDDARGNLTLEYVRLANAIDNERRRLGRGGIVIVWENVPGVLSTRDNAFGCFLAGLVGADAPLVPPRGQRWTDAGLVAGPRRVAAWRILDSQYFGLAQRRRRVFVVGCPLEGPDPAEILPERDGVRRDHPPSRETGALATQALTRSLGAGGADDNRAQGGFYVPFGQSGERDVGSCLTNHQGRYDLDTETFIAHTLRGEGFDASEDGTGRGTPLVPMLSTTLRARPGAKGVDSDATDTLIPTAYRTAGDGSVYEEGDVTAPLTTGTDSSASIVAFDTTQITSAANYSNPKVGDACHPLAAGAHAPAVAFQASQSGMRLGGAVHPTLDSNNGSRRHHGALTEAGVRRLMPVECERLQGIPDGYTAIEIKGEVVADSPRYKSLGNTMSGPVVEWIGRRIDRAIRAHRMGSAA